MKNLLYLLALGLILNSCEKDCPPDEPTVPIVPGSINSIFKFEGNGIQYDYSGSLVENARKGSVITLWKWDAQPYHYAFNAMDKQPYPNRGFYVSFDIISNGNLKPGTYTLANNQIADVECWFFGLTTYHRAESFQVIISKIDNGLASGTFIGKVLKTTISASSPESVVITNGIFERVKILE